MTAQTIASNLSGPPEIEPKVETSFCLLAMDGSLCEVMLEACMPLNENIFRVVRCAWLILPCSTCARVRMRDGVGSGVLRVELRILCIDLFPLLDTLCQRCDDRNRSIDLHANLLHAVALTNRNALVVLRLEIDWKRRKRDKRRGEQQISIPNRTHTELANRCSASMRVAVVRFYVLVIPNGIPISSARV